MTKVYALWHCDEQKGNKRDVVLYSSRDKLMKGIASEIDCGNAEREKGYDLIPFKDMTVLTLSEIDERIKYLTIECLEVR